MIQPQIEENKMKLKEVNDHIKKEENELRKLKANTKHQIESEVEKIKASTGQADFEFKRINSYIE